MCLNLSFTVYILPEFFRIFLHCDAMSNCSSLCNLRVSLLTIFRLDLYLIRIFWSRVSMYLVSMYLFISVDWVNVLYTNSRVLEFESHLFPVTNALRVRIDNHFTTIINATN